MDKQRKPPAYLTSKARRWFRAVAGEYVFQHEPEWALLEMAAATLDRIDQARKAIADHGLIVPTGQGDVKPNPAANLERDNKILLCRIMRELRLADPADESRIPRIGGY
jgi:phage terminase small subunit